MIVRKLKQSDIPVLRGLHKKAGYTFPFPNLTGMEVAFVAEEKGFPIGVVGAELRAEITGIFDLDYGSPHERMKVFASLHLPVAEALDLREVKKAYCFCDPAFPRFGQRLSELGWDKTWDCFVMGVKECITALRRRTL